MKIALLADLSVQARAIADSLSRAGLYCNTYHASQALFHGIDQAAYDVLLIDHELADMPAVDAVRTCMAPAAARCPSWCLQPARRRPVVVNTLQAGADDYMIRPLRSRELVASAPCAAAPRTASRGQSLDRAIKVGPLRTGLPLAPGRIPGPAAAADAQGVRSRLAAVFQCRTRPIAHAYRAGGYGATRPKAAVVARAASLVSRLRRTLRLCPRQRPGPHRDAHAQGYRLDQTGPGLAAPSPRQRFGRTTAAWAAPLRPPAGRSGIRSRRSITAKPPRRAFLWLRARPWPRPASSIWLPPAAGQPGNAFQHFVVLDPHRASKPSTRRGKPITARPPRSSPWMPPAARSAPLHTSRG
ncbi:hypothetical protein ACU4GD_24245 [Cupriavidus basilensis]